MVHITLHCTFGRLDKRWKKNGCSIKTKIRLYNAIVVSTLLYESETWPMTVANKKRREAAHHRWLRRIHQCVMPRQRHKQKYKGEDGTGAMLVLTCSDAQNVQ